MDMSSNQIFYIVNPNKYILSQHGRQKKKKKNITFVLFIITCIIIDCSSLRIVCPRNLLYYVHEL